MQLSRIEVVAYLSAVVLFFLAHVFFDAPFWWLYVSAGCAGAVAFFAERKRHAESLPPGSKTTTYVCPYTVKFNDNEVAVFIDGKQHEGVAWADLIVVGIRIESQGFIDVPYWILGGRSGGCMYPSDAVGHEAVTEEFKTRLPGFDCKETYATMAKAMTALEGGFVVWERPAENAI